MVPLNLTYRATVILVLVYWSPIWDAVYISDVNGAKKVKYYARVAINKKTQTPCDKFTLGVVGNSAATQFFLNFWNCPKLVKLGTRKIIFGLPVNIENVNSRSYPVDGIGVCSPPPLISILPVYL